MAFQSYDDEKSPLLKDIDLTLGTIVNVIEDLKGGELSKKGFLQKWAVEISLRQKISIADGIKEATKMYEAIEKANS